MKPAQVVCISLMLAGTLLLAQSGRFSLANQANGLPVAEQAQTGLSPSFPVNPRGELFPQTKATEVMARTASTAHSRRLRIKPQVQTGAEQVLYAFQGGTDGEVPEGNLIFDSSGNLYGTTRYGGVQTGGGYGTVFELSLNGSGGWSENILYRFQGSSDGAYPTGNVILDEAGNLYGTTVGGGSVASCSGGCGTVFELSPSQTGGWTETVLYRFGAYSGDAANPVGGLIFDKSGNLYGAAGGGQYVCNSFYQVSCGSVFGLKPNGVGGWTESVLYSFGTGSDGNTPNAPLIFDAAGNLYGTTEYGGGTSQCTYNVVSGCGTAFELSPNGSGGWTATVLYAFQSGTDGAEPEAGPIFDKSGNLYGTTYSGGNTQAGWCGLGGQDRCGTVFELSPNGSGGWKEAVLYNFQAGSDGSQPLAGLIFDQSGNLYGTTFNGGNSTGCYGAAACGTVFELSPNGSGGWTETVIYTFQGDNNGGGDGGWPQFGVILDQAGHLYGTTPAGGTSSCDPYGYGCGVVYEVFWEPYTMFSPTSLNFGNQSVGIPTWRLTTLTNSGSLPLVIDSIQITGANSGDFSQKNNCPSSLPPSMSCTIWPIFDPTAAGTRNAALTVTDNAPGSPQQVPLTGVGLLAGATLSPASLNFGNQTGGATSSPLAITVTDTGQGNLAVSSVVITGANASEFAQTNNCTSQQLGPQWQCQISVTFTPTALGNANAAISVTDNAPGSPQTVPLSGTGIAGVSFSPPNITFGGQYVEVSGLPQNVTLTNTGDSVLTITNVTASPASDFRALSGCGNSVQPSGYCSIGVFFDPSTSGNRNGVLTITDSAHSSPQTVPLSGMGEDFSVAPSSSSSATVTPGQNAQYTIAVAPLGGFNQMVTLSCTGAPAMSTCSVSPSSVKLSSSGSTPVTVSVATTASSAALWYPGGSTPTLLGTTAQPSFPW